MDDYKNKCEELRNARQETVREFLTLQESHRVEMRIVNNSLQEETNARESLERRLSELRGELERLQSENATEWAKRERLETEKINLERENKKIKTELIDFQVSHRPGFNGSSRSSNMSESEIRCLQQELLERNKVNITNLKFCWFHSIVNILGNY